MKTKLTLERDTKGTFVYKNDEDNAPIRSLYISRSAVKGEAPKSITIEIKELKD
jgi:hypothetical protein